MDLRQRIADQQSADRMARFGHQSQIWTALPGIIQSVNLSAMTVEIQPSIQGVLSDPKTGAASNTDLPLLVDCPIIFPLAGGVALTLPIAAGDECLVIFASRCIDAWWQQGGVQPPMVYRMHDLSDGFCLPGVRSKPNTITGISATTAQLRSNDGATYVEVDPASQRVNIVAPGGIFLNGIHFDAHVHGGVQSGSANTIGPQ